MIVIMEVGDVILEERPVAWGPKQLSKVCCVACCAPLGYFEISWCDRYLAISFNIFNLMRQ